jgi:hypothetical protein
MDAQLSLTACSLCLRVWDGGGWVDADRAIRRLRSYELPTPVRLAPGLCDGCSDAIARRRAAAVDDCRLAA